MDILGLVQEGKIKRVFRTRGKISFPGAVCHITQRAAGKEPLFLEDGDYLYMLYLIKKSREEFNFEVFSHCLMPNHVHLLIRLFNDNLSQAMKRLYGGYASYFNKKYKRKGHVFGGAFRQALCLGDRYLLAASLYIHINPVRGKLASDPQKYRWSSCKLYTEPFNGNTFVNYKFILELLDSNIAEAQKIYKNMLHEAIAIRAKEVWEEPNALESFKIKAARFLPTWVKEESEAQEGFLDERDLEAKIAQLGAKGRLGSPESFKARKFLIEQLLARGYSVKVITEMLNISRRTVYYTLIAHF